MPDFNRRQALRMAGSTAASLPFVGTTIASKGDGKKPYTGVSYSTLTHEVQGEGFSSLNFTKDSVQGKLEVGGFNIPVGSQDSMRSPYGSPDHDKYVIVKDQPRFVEDGKPLKIKINNHPRNVNGYITRPGPYAKLGFTMGPEEEDNPGDVRKGLMGKGKGREDSLPQAVPNEGLPEHVSIAEHWKWENDRGAFGGELDG